MTTFDINEPFVRPIRPAHANVFARLYSAWRRHREKRITLGQLSHMNAYMLRDMGIEPQDIIAAMEGRESSILFNPVRKHE